MTDSLQQWHDVHTNFHENLSIGAKDIKGADSHTYVTKGLSAVLLLFLPTDAESQEAYTILY
jgi:hypothetical protein